MAECTRTKEDLIKSLKRNRICDQDDIPIACMIYAVMLFGPSFVKCKKWAGIGKWDVQSKRAWQRLKKAGIITKTGLFLDKGNATISFCLAINVAKGLIAIHKKPL